MKGYSLFYNFCAVVSFCATACLQIHCREETRKTEYRYVQPQYSLQQLAATTDTVSFQLDTATYNRIRSFNYFVDKGIEYIAFYDKQSLSINIYDFNSDDLKKRIQLEKWLPKKKLKKATSVFVKNFDSIYVINMFSLYRLDGSGKRKSSVALETEPVRVLSSFENRVPPIFKGDTLYTTALPVLSPYDRRHLNKWRVLYSINMKEKSTALEYRLPEIYKKNEYSILFFDCSYCFNKQGRFVFSFAADTNIYESDLGSHYYAYYGKSRFQANNVKPMTALEMENSEEIEKSFLLRDAYGAIYYDPNTQRYLRVASSRISEKDYKEKRWEREQSIIIFDEKFRIIGESRLDKGISLSSIFFTKGGDIYARTNLNDEYALHFVRLAYCEPDGANTLGKK